MPTKDHGSSRAPEAPAPVPMLWNERGPGSTSSVGFAWPFLGYVRIFSSASTTTTSWGRDSDSRPALGPSRCGLITQRSRHQPLSFTETSARKWLAIVALPDHGAPRSRLGYPRRRRLPYSPGTRSSNARRRSGCCAAGCARSRAPYGTGQPANTSTSSRGLDRAREPRGRSCRSTHQRRPATSGRGSPAANALRPPGRE
jgi:hypothetical protein